MDLWIRSQDKTRLIKAEDVRCDTYVFHRIIVNGTYFGAYKTEERALEVLDEIQRCLKGRTIISPRRITDYERIKEKFFAGGFIITDGSVDVIPSDVIVYEMPKE